MLRAPHLQDHQPGLELVFVDHVLQENHRVGHEAFDAEPARKRDKKITLPILGIAEMPRFIADHNVRMAILSVPAAVAQEVANNLTACGVMGILNFAPIVLTVPEDVMVNNVNLAIELENLSYFIQG